MNRPIRVLTGAFALLLTVGLLAQPAQAQFYTSVGGGIASPRGDFGDVYDTGYTLRGQVGISLLTLVAGHLQVGWNRFPAQDAFASTVEDADIYHVAAGARLGLGLIFVGANAGYFFGDDPGDSSELGFFPEAGVQLGPLEVVADYRIDGDANWFGLRGAFRF